MLQRLSVPLFFLIATTALATASCAPRYSGVAPALGPKDTPESVLGERLFRETRFSAYFAHNSAGNPNARLAQGDPALRQLPGARRGELSSPFASQSMSCVSCHMVDDARAVSRGGMRGYNDFAQRSPIPHRDGDSGTVTPRNSPTMLGAFVNRTVPFLLHYDGEFTTIEDLVLGGFTGRNFGWLPTERDQAIAHLIRVVREDDGGDPLAARFSNRISYREMLKGENTKIPGRARISSDLRLDPVSASDQQVLSQVLKLVTIYLQALQFSTDPGTGAYNASPYDQFLLKNGLPRQPDDGESDERYAGRLAWAMQGLGAPQFVEGFGEKELEGARIFLARSTEPSETSPGHFQVGNCVACHAPPHFSDFKMHNTGETQDEYDELHGPGSFAKLHVPTKAERDALPEAYLPATAAHPQGTSRFRSAPSRHAPGFTDLGAWNILGNADVPAPQGALELFFCPAAGCQTAADREQALVRSLATFKTPGLRGLSLSDPYMHTGRKNTVGDVLRFYQQGAEMQRQGLLRNGDPELARIRINAAGVQSLNAFLDALNEDYE